MHATAIMASSALQTLAMQYKSYAVLFAAAAIATLAITPLYVRLAAARGWVDRPGGRKAHERPVPTMGGVVIFAVVAAGVGVTLLWGNRVSEMLRQHASYVLGALACTAAAVTLGIVDDLRGVRPKIKLLVQLLIAVAAYFLGFNIPAITLPGLGSTPLGGVSLALTVLWILAIINAINFTDGLDGLAAGVCFLAAGVNAGVAVWLENYYMAVMMLLLAGALLGFLRWNFHPARVFLGDAGSLGLGTFLALCSLHSAQKSHTAVMILVPLCALGYPIFDLLLAVARRTLRGQPVWASDHDHIHHRLLARGHSPARAAIMIYVGSIVLAAACLVAMTANHLAVGLTVAALVVLAVFSVRVLGYLEWTGLRGREETKVLHAAAQLARLKLSAARSSAEVGAALRIFTIEAGIPTFSLEGPQIHETFACAGGRFAVNDSPDMGVETPAEWMARIGYEQLSVPLGSSWKLTLMAPHARLVDTEVRALLDDLARIAAQSLSGEG